MDPLDPPILELRVCMRSIIRHCLYPRETCFVRSMSHINQPVCGLFYSTWWSYILAIIFLVFSGCQIERCRDSNSIYGSNARRAEYTWSGYVALSGPRADTVLRPGDVLWIPRFRLGCASILHDQSVHQHDCVDIWSKPEFWPAHSSVFGKRLEYQF